jgi:hypothetical protein
MRTHKRYCFFISFLVISILFMSFSRQIILTHAQGNLVIPPQSAKYNMIESAEIIGSNESINSISIPIPSKSWNITNVELNFSNIKLGKELNVIEDGGNQWEEIKSGKEGWGVQINITEPTIIFGAYLFGSLFVGNPTFPRYVQITGYDIGTNAPNGKIYGSTMLNMSSALDWYLHTFPTPINLTIGQYYLIIDGTEIHPSDKAIHIWVNNDDNPQYPALHISNWDGSKWTDGVQGKPFRYKLIQRINRSYNPEETNMTAVFNGSSYTILNGKTEGTGILKINDTFTPNKDFFEISIQNNISIGLIFDLNYSLKLSNYFISRGELKIKEGSANRWILTPTINRLLYNYTVKFKYPSSWYNLTVERNGIDISSIVTINTLDKFIYLPNIAIIDGALWTISANSPNLGLSLNLPKTKFEPNQDLEFSVLPPVNPGNLTYLLINSLGFEEFNKTVIVLQTTTAEIVFSYTLSSNPNEGIYKAYVYWYDGKDASLITQEFQVNVPFVLAPQYIIAIVVSATLLIVGIVGSYKLVKRSRRIHEEYRQKIYNKYMDALNLDYFIVIEKRTGLNIYEQVLAGKDIDASLITGFLEAIRSFGIELTGANEQSQTIKLEYHQSKVIMSEFKDFRILLIMKENPSQDFLESLKTLSYDIDNIFREELTHFKGNIDSFKDIKDLLDKHLYVPLIYPLKVKPLNVKINSEEKAMINRAINIMKERKINYFYVSYLLSTKKGFQLKDAETILNLIGKKLFQPKE